MTDITEKEMANAGSEEMTEFCAAIGELILWANMIDGQLNKAMICALSLPEHPMIESVVAQLDPRPKAELLKKRARFIANVDWRNGIRRWVERAEKVNSYRNYVAHHAIRVKAGKITFHSDQLGKILEKLNLNNKVFEIAEGKGIKDVKEWIEYAKKVITEGDNVLINLDRVRTDALNMLAKKN